MLGAEGRPQHVLAAAEVEGWLRAAGGLVEGLLPPTGPCCRGPEAQPLYLHFREQGGKAVPKPQIQKKLDSLHIHTHSLCRLVAFGISASIRGMSFQTIAIFAPGKGNLPPGCLSPVQQFSCGLGKLYFCRHQSPHATRHSWDPA